MPPLESIVMQDIAEQKARLNALNLRARLLGFSVHASIGSKVHYGWWYLVASEEPYRWPVAVICKNLDEADRFIRQEEVDQKKEILKRAG